MVVPVEMVEEADGVVEVEGWHQSQESERRYAIVAGLREPVEPLSWPALPPDGLREGQCRPWLLPAIYERARGGTQQFLAELRPAAALFCKFGGIDYDADEDAGNKLDAYIRWVQAVIHRHEGSLIQLSIGERGAIGMPCLAPR